MAQLGVVKSNQVIMDFGKLTIWDSLLLACAEARFERPHRILSERSVYSRHEEEIRAWLDFFPFVDPTGLWDVCERVNFMAEGQVLLQGDPEEIRKHSTVIEKYLGKGHVAG